MLQNIPANINTPKELLNTFKVYRSTTYTSPSYLQEAQLTNPTLVTYVLEHFTHEQLSQQGWWDTYFNGDVSSKTNLNNLLSLALTYKEETNQDIYRLAYAKYYNGDPYAVVTNQAQQDFHNIHNPISMRIPAGGSL